MLLATAASTFLAGCGGPASGDAGLAGTVLVSPASPVCRTDNSCTRPARGLTLMFVRGGRSYETKTDGKGHYSIALSPGAYRVQVPGARLRTSLTPRKARVKSGGFGKLDFRYDPGIR
jgi:hypothetical protein